MRANNLKSGARYTGVINHTFYGHCVKLARTLLLGEKQLITEWIEGDTELVENSNIPDMEVPFAVLLMHDPLNAEMAHAFAKRIVKTVVMGKQFNATLKEEMHIMFEICKVWSWGHTYLEQGNAEVPGWFFRHVELFLYHTLLEVIHRIGDFSHQKLKQASMTNEKLCEAIRIVCRMAEGCAESLPAGSMSREAVKDSGALLLVSACESVEFSILNELPAGMNRGHVVFAMVVAEDAMHNPARDPLTKGNLFAHLFAYGTPLNFLRRVAGFVANWKDKMPAKLIGSVEVEMRVAVMQLDEEARNRRRNNKEMAKRAAKAAALRPPFTTQRARAARTPSPLSRAADEGLTPRDLFGSDCDDEDTVAYQTPKRKAEIASASSTKKPKPSSNEWMVKYPGVTKKGYWDEDTEENPGGELETELKNALRMASPSDLQNP